MGSKTSNSWRKIFSYHKLEVVHPSNVQKLCKIKSEPHSQGQQSKPATDMFKLNVDASYHRDEGEGATGVVIHDARGNFITGSCVLIYRSSDATTTESLAMKHGLTLATSLGLQRIIAESNSLEVVNACTGTNPWWTDMWKSMQIVTDLMVEMGTFISSTVYVKQIVLLMRLLDLVLRVSFLVIVPMNPPLVFYP